MHDYHVHSNYSRDSQASLEALAESARSKGIVTLALTDHIDFDLMDDLEFRYDERLKHIGKINQKYPDLRILNGIEMGLDPNRIEEMEAYMEAHPFEHRILSLHAIDGEDLFEGAIFENNDPLEILRRYALLMTVAVDKLESFDVVGHLDYLRRYSSVIDDQPIEALADLFTPLLEILVDKDKGLEINTSANHYGNEWFYPHPVILKRYADLGGRWVTIGSDSHRGETLGRDFGLACKWINALGLERRGIQDDCEVDDSDGEQQEGGQSL